MLGMSERFAMLHGRRRIRYRDLNDVENPLHRPALPLCPRKIRQSVHPCPCPCPGEIRGSHCKSSSSRTPRIPAQHPWSSCHHQARNACIASTPTVPSSCKLCTPISTRPSSLSLPSCGKQVLSDHHNRTACDHNDAFLARKEMPFRPCIA